MLNDRTEKLIFEKSVSGRQATTQIPKTNAQKMMIDDDYLREDKPVLPEISELEVVRHYTRLSQLNFCIDTNFYPLGSCTMKYNPKHAHQIANRSVFAEKHPRSHVRNRQGTLYCLYQLQIMLARITGMARVSLAPMAGAQGEYSGVAMIRAYHLANNNKQRDEIIVPDAAHGTNAATARMCGMKVKEVKTSPETGEVQIDKLKQMLGDKTAGIMLTNPSTLGIFESKIETIAELVHQAGGLLYYDGANLNAIMGKVRPGEMGFDVIHLNMHKTFATPHGGGGPGSGPLAVNETLAPYLPVPMVECDSENGFYFVDEQKYDSTIGHLSAFNGNVGVLLRAYVYISMLGHDGLIEASEMATLNANYLMTRLKEHGFTVAYPNRFATHEFIITLEKEAKEYGVTAGDFAKCLLDYGMHAPTMYFPLLVPECLLIEPTETENKQTLDRFVDIMVAVKQKIAQNPDYAHEAPYTLPVRRLDEVKAVKELNLKWHS